MARKFSQTIRLRVTPEEYRTAIDRAALHQETLSSYARKALAGVPMVSHLDQEAVAKGDGSKRKGSGPSPLAKS